MKLQKSKLGLITSIKINDQKRNALIFSVLAVVVIYSIVLYLNFLPFGLDQNVELSVGTQEDTIGIFKILPAESWGDREVDKDGQTYRNLLGSSEVVYQPKLSLKSSLAKLEIDGENVWAYPPTTSIPIEETEWAYNWDLSKQIPTEFVGNPYIFDGCAYFDGTSELKYTNSRDLFETGPFSFYIEWMPLDPLDYQQIIGHFNWELYQSRKFVVFQIGKMVNSQQAFYSIKAPITSSFFSNKHSILIQYAPDADNGYIEMFIDDSFVSRKYIGSAKIDPSYGDRPLSLGWSPHNYQQNPNFEGCIYKILNAEKTLILPFSSLEYVVQEDNLRIDLVGNGSISGIKLNITK